MLFIAYEYSVKYFQNLLVKLKKYFTIIKNHLISLKLSARVESMKLFRVCLDNPKNRYETNNCVINVAYAAPVIP